MKTLFKIIVAPFKIVATFITILLMLGTAAILLLSVLFAYRASIPMTRLEFGGLSYFEYTQYREWAHRQNSLFISTQREHPEVELSCAGFDRYDDIMVLSIGTYASQGNPSKTWTFFENSLYEMDFEKKGLRFGRDIGCDIPLSPSISAWKKMQASKETSQ
jgi:hypothetical protein